MATKKAAKKPTAAQRRKKLINKLDRLAKLHARYKNAYIYQGVPHAVCVTCTREKPIDRNLHGGHFIKSTVWPIRWDHRNIHAQCLTEESKLKMFNGKQVSIADIKAGDRLWAFDEDTYEQTSAFVLSTKSFVPDRLYEVELEDGSRFYATPDHRVVANGEWVYVEDMLHSELAYDILEI